MTRYATLKATASLQPRRLAARRRPLRIMHVISSLGYGGLELGILKLMNGLDPDLFEHRICAIRDSDAAFVQAHNLGGALDVVGTSEQRLQFPFFRLKAVFQRHRPDIVHTRNWGALEAVPAARFAGISTVIHSEHGYETDMLSSMPLRRRTFRRFAYALTDDLFALACELRDYHCRQAWMSVKSMKVLYNGVDTSRFCPSIESRERVRACLNISPATIVLGSVGRMVSIKDYPSLLGAAERLLANSFDIKVLLVGDGPEVTTLQKRVAESSQLRDRVIFGGVSDRISEMLNAMDLFVLPSLGEGMSNTLLEAMATGLPLLATNVGGNPEVIQDHQTGYLFPPRDVPKLIDLAAQLCADFGLRRQLGAAGRARAIKEFSLEAMLKRYQELYQGAVQQHSLAATA